MFRIILISWLSVLFSYHTCLAEERYDISYVWDDNLDNVLDYQSQLAELFDDDVVRHLRIVQRDDGRFGVIYDLDGTAHTSAQIMVKQSELLRTAEFSECMAVKDEGYHELYNVSYGLGPNIDALKKRYEKIYRVLGSEVGSNLFIEQTSAGNFTLIYRRRGDRSSTYEVAKNHAKKLKRYRISTTIIVENNNPVMFGEASMLDDQSGEVAEQPEQVVVETVHKEPVAPSTTISSESVNSALSRSIEDLIDEVRRQGRLTGDERTGWMVYDLANDRLLADINGEQSFQAASMIKPFVALAFFHRVAKGELSYGPKSRQNMERMIQHSNNGSTNWIMKRTGGPEEINRLLQQSYQHIFHQTKIVEYIPPGGKTYMNSAAPADYIRFLQSLWDDKLPYSKEIRRLMSLPKRNRLYHGTPIPRGTLVYSKSGSTAHLCGDMGILVLRGKNGQRYPYAMIGVIERASRAKDYGSWMLTRGDVIRKVSTLVYQKMKTSYPIL